MKKLPFLFAASLLAVSSAADATTTRYRVSGESASMGCDATPDPCSYVSFSAFADENITVENGTSTSTTQVFGNFSYGNYCTGEYYFGSIVGDASTFDINGLQSASISLSIPVDSYIYDPVAGAYVITPAGNAVIDVALDGVGETFRGMATSHGTSPGFKFFQRFKSAYRDADVTGTLTYDGASFADLTCAGVLYDVQSGSRIVTQ